MNTDKPQTEQKINEEVDDLVKQLKDWSTRTRSDAKALQSMLDNPDDLFAVKGMAQDVLNNLDELDKLLEANTGKDNLSTPNR